ncbi:MAG: GAF domain-containing protein [Bdellovibrionia bacterium]
MSHEDDLDLKSLDEISMNLPSKEGSSRSPESGGEGLFTGGLFFGSSNTAQIKLTALETFVNSAVRNCSFTELITDILLAIMNAIPSEAASVLEVDSEKNSLFFRCSAGRASDVLNGFVFPLGKGIAGQALNSRRPVIVDNAEENKVHLKAIGDAVGFETSNMIAVPLIIRDKAYGVLELLNRAGQPNFSPEDVDMASYLCEMAVKVIELRMMIAWEK